MGRTAAVERNTSETKIKISLNLDGTGKSNIDTGIGFFDHMLTSFSKHSFIDLDVKVDGDLRVDGHHSVEDTGIVLGTAIKEALGDKKGIRRYGSFMLPMDETLVMCAVDLCGRPYFSSDLTFTMPKIGELDSELIREFFYAVSYSAAMNLHLKQLDGSNNHHIAEAAFKAFAKAMAEAVSIDPRIEGTLSTKGTI
ncbi:MAG: imidazoleglycerol-phosphate dehydratase HisB [Lachnospiraceae bacterium]|nr:imidazoleglycerol-phosphate dehydratase HisB [Lachnospiraceae bacterium]